MNNSKDMSWMTLVVVVAAAFILGAVLTMFLKNIKRKS